MRDNDTDPQPYGGLPPHQRHSDTSYRAAVSMLDEARTLRARVYRYILNRGPSGATDEEIIVASDRSASSIRPRRCELADRGLVIDSGRKRATRSGRAAVVWVVGNAETFRREVAP